MSKRVNKNQLLEKKVQGFQTAKMPQNYISPV